MSMARIQKSRPLRDLTRTQFHCQVWNSLDQSPTARHVADPSSRFQIPCTAVPLRGKNQEQHAKHPNQLFLALGDGSTAPFWWGPILCRSLKTLLLSGGFLPTLWLPPPGNHWQYDAARHKLFSCLLMFMKQLIELHNITQLPRSSQSLQPQGQAKMTKLPTPPVAWVEHLGHPSAQRYLASHRDDHGPRATLNRMLCTSRRLGVENGIHNGQSHVVALASGIHLSPQKSGLNSGLDDLPSCR